MAITGDTYKKIGRAAAGSVSVVTVLNQENRIVGLTVSTFVTLSFEPPLVMFAIQHDANSYPAFVESQAFGVSVLRADQVDIAKRFATKGADKITGTQFESGEIFQVPLIVGAMAQVECSTNEIFVSGDHAIIVGLVEAARASNGDPLLYFERGYGTFSSLPES